MVSITIRFTDEEHNALKKASIKDERSLNKFVVLAVKEKIKRDNKKEV